MKNVEADKPSSRKLYQRKGWKGFVASYSNMLDNGNWNRIKWSKETNAIEVTDNGISKIYKY